MDNDNEAPARTGPTPIPTDPPEGFDPQRIIVRELYRDQHNKPRYRLVDRRRRYISDTRFRQLVARVAGRDDWHGTTDNEEPEHHVLNIPVYLPSYIVVKINDNLGPFSPPGIELTSANNAYGELRYVTRAGVISDQWPDEGCWVIYFAALLRTGSVHGPYRQGINYYATQGLYPPGEEAAYAREPIDPDIRYPGNGGQIDEP